jgi:hypothetical protein
MPFALGDDVYVKTTIDTGEVRASFPPAEHDVFCDSISQIVRLSEDSIRKLPHKCRAVKDGFLVITKARRTWRGRRKLEISHYIILKDGVVSSRKFRHIRLSEI